MESDQRDYTSESDEHFDHDSSGKRQLPFAIHEELGMNYATFVNSSSTSDASFPFAAFASFACVVAVTEREWAV